VKINSKLTLNRSAACAMTQDFARGVRAFVAKQKPGFLGN